LSAAYHTVQLQLLYSSIVVMILLGVGAGFQIGTASAAPPAMDLPLGSCLFLDFSVVRLQKSFSSHALTMLMRSLAATDELIKARAKSSVKPSVSNNDRAIGTRNARREAAMNARRGLSTSNKPTQMEIEKAVTKQANQTAIKKATKMAKEKPAASTGLTLKEKVARRRNKREVMVAGAAAAVAEKVVIPLAQPSKNALKAARAALVGAKYEFPPNCEIKIVPKQVAPKTPQQRKSSINAARSRNAKNEVPNQPGQQQHPKSNNGNRRRGGAQK
jgi:hypothetical protein